MFIDKIRPLLFWTTIWLITIVLYRPCYGSLFVDDFITGILSFKAQGWAGFADSYGFTSLYYGHNFFFLGFYSLFGASHLAWFLLFTGLHSLNATLVYVFFKRLFTNNHFGYATGVALVTCLLFLVSPYQVENVVWGATLHYALCMLFMWCIMLLYASYLQRGGVYKLWLSYLLFAVALVTLEIALVFPIIFLLVFGVLWRQANGAHTPFRLLKLLVLPMLVLVGAYLLLSLQLKGDMIGHYGSDMHLKCSIPQIFGNWWRYLAKLLGYVHFWPQHQQTEVYVRLGHHIFTYGLWAALAAIWVWLYRIRPRAAWFALGWGAVAFVALLPVLNMLFIYFHNGENARLSYFASPFVLAMPVLFLSWVAPRYIIAYALLMMGLNATLLHTQTTKWHYAALAHQTALDSPLFYGPGKAYLLNLPSYYDGAYVFRNQHRLHWARAFHGLPQIFDKLEFLLSANMHTPADSVIVTALPQANTYKVAFATAGNWFWHNGYKTISRSDKDMTVTIDENHHSYTLTIPNLKPEDKLLYFTLNGWQQVPRQIEKDSTFTAKME